MIFKKKIKGETSRVKEEEMIRKKEISGETSSKKRRRKR